MASQENEILDRLDAGERGFVLGALLLQPSGGSDPSAGLEPPSDTRCGEALARIAALPRGERVKLTRQLAREVVAPIPAGIEAVNPAVLAALLGGEPPDILRLVARTAPPWLRQEMDARLAGEPSLGPAPAHPPEASPSQGSSARAAVAVPSPSAPEDADATRTVVAASAPQDDEESGVPDGTSTELVMEIQRALFSRVVPVHPAGRTSAPLADTPRGLLLLDPARLTAELSRRGAGVLGQSVHGARREVILRAAAVAGAPWAAQILAAAVSPPDRASSEAHPDMDRRAAVELVAAAAPGSASGETVTRLGARAAGAWMTREGERGLSGADQARALAQRCPPAVGAELLSGAGLGAETV